MKDFFKTLFSNWNGVFIAVFILLLSRYPYVFSSFWNIPYNIFVDGLSIILFFLIYSRLPKLYGISSTLKSIMVAQAAVWIVYTMYHGALMYASRCVLMLEVMLMILCVLNSKHGIEAFFRKYNSWILLMAVGATIGFVLIVFANFPSLRQYVNYDGRIGDFYGFTCARTVWAGYQYVRVSGFLDEAGALASWGVFALVINRIINNTKHENALSALLLSTMSVGYFVQGTLFLLVSKVKKFSSVLFGVLLVSIFAFATYSTKNTQYENIYTMTWGRLEYDAAEGTISGNSRAELSKMAKAEFVKDPIFGVGGMEFHKEYMDDNPYETLGRDGIVGTFFLYLPLLYAIILCIRNRRYDLFFLLLVLAVGYLQRPLKDNLLHYFMLYSIVVLIERSVRGAIINGNDYE